MISHLSIHQRHETPHAGIWTILNRDELNYLRWHYRQARRDGASKYIVRSLIANTLRIGRFDAHYTPTAERAA